ncbi:hypothetical protein PSPO01_01864 [Paraphaeosphaeria sporulosa]
MRFAYGVRGPLETVSPSEQRISPVHRYIQSRAVFQCPPSDTERQLNSSDEPRKQALPPAHAPLPTLLPAPSTHPHPTSASRSPAPIYRNKTSLPPLHPAERHRPNCRRHRKNRANATQDLPAYARRQLTRSYPTARAAHTTSNDGARPTRGERSDERKVPAIGEHGSSTSANLFSSPRRPSEPSPTHAQSRSITSGRWPGLTRVGCLTPALRGVKQPILVSSVQHLPGARPQGHCWSNRPEPAGARRTMGDVSKASLPCLALPGQPALGLEWRAEAS